MSAALPIPIRLFIQILPCDRLSGDANATPASFVLRNSASHPDGGSHQADDSDGGEPATAASRVALVPGLRGRRDRSVDFDDSPDGDTQLVGRTRTRVTVEDEEGVLEAGIHRSDDHAAA